MTASCSYTQFPLARMAPVTLTAPCKVRFEIALGADGKRVDLRFLQEGTKDQDYIAITEDTLVEIVLKGDQLFFSKAFDAITMKDDLQYFYGGLEYDGFDEDLDRYKVVRFLARFNKGGKLGTRHAFNVNVDLLRSDHGQPPKWIALTIDPDIKNPPPRVGQGPIP